MSLVTDDAVDRLTERLAAVSRVDRIEAMSVALTNKLRLREASPTKETAPHPPGKGSAA